MWKTTKELAWMEGNSAYPAEAPHSCSIAFDLDHTLVKPHGRRKHPKDADDWEYMPNVRDTIVAAAETHNIVIFTNQATTRPQVIKNRIANIVKDLAVSVQVYVALDYNIFRKPSTGMYDFWKEQNPTVELVKYVGDAAGRSSDFSDSDFGFAQNINVPFMVPEEYFGWDGPREPIIIKPVEITLQPCPAIPAADLVIIVGYPNTGQDAIREQLSDHVIRYTRHKVFPKKCLISGYFMSKAERAKIIAKVYPRKITCIYINATMEQSQRMSLYKMRLQYFNRKGNVATRAKGLKMPPRQVFYGLRKKFNKPLKTEGFDQVIEVSICNIDWNLEILNMF